MQPISHRFPAGVAEDARQQLQSFVTRTQGIVLALLTSGDGFEIAAHPGDLPAAQRLAAMSSSLQALSEAMVREAGLVRIRNLIIECEGGTVVVLGVGNATPRLSLTIVARADQTLGHVLWASRECCAGLERRLLPATV